MSQSSESLVDWMIQLDASGATKTLAEFVGKSKDEIKALDTQSKSLSLSRVILKAIAPIAPLLAGFALGGPLGAAIAPGLTALGKNSESSGKSGSLSPVPKGFEDVDASFNRINEAATKLNLDQVRNDLLRQIANNTRPIGSAPNTNNTAPQGNQVGF